MMDQCGMKQIYGEVAGHAKKITVTTWVHGN